jgi:hypothetical protein
MYKENFIKYITERIKKEQDNLNKNLLQNALAFTNELIFAISLDPDVDGLNSFLEYKEIGISEQKNSLPQYIYSIRISEYSEAIVYCYACDITGILFSFSFELHEVCHTNPIFKQPKNERIDITVREFISNVLKPYVIEIQSMSYKKGFHELAEISQYSNKIQEAACKMLTEVNTLLVSEELKKQTKGYIRPSCIYRVGKNESDDSVFFSFLILIGLDYEFTITIKNGTIDNMISYSLFLESDAIECGLHTFNGYSPSEIIEATKEQLIKISRNEY